MKIEKVWGLARRLQNGDRRSPAIAVSLAHGEIVQRREGHEVSGGNQRAARDVTEIPRKLRPKARLRVHVLAYYDRPEILQLLRYLLNAFFEIAQTAAERAHGQMMIAEHRLARDQFVARDVYGRLDRGSLLVRGGNLALDFRHMRHHRRAVFECE